MFSQYIAVHIQFSKEVHSYLTTLCVNCLTALSESSSSNQGVFLWHFLFFEQWNENTFA